MAVATPTTPYAVDGAGGGSLTGDAGFSQFVINDSQGYPTDPVLRVKPNGHTTATDAFTNSSFFSFALTVGSNVSDLDLTSISLDAARGGSGTPSGFAIRVDTPTTADEVVRTAQNVGTERSTFTLHTRPPGESENDKVHAEILSLVIPRFIAKALHRHREQGDPYHPEFMGTEKIIEIIEREILPLAKKAPPRSGSVGASPEPVSHPLRQFSAPASGHR